MKINKALIYISTYFMLAPFQVYGQKCSQKKEKLVEYAKELIMTELYGRKVALGDVCLKKLKLKHVEVVHEPYQELKFPKLNFVNEKSVKVSEIKRFKKSNYFDVGYSVRSADGKVEFKDKLNMRVYQSSEKRGGYCANLYNKSGRYYISSACNKLVSASRKK